MLKHFSDFNQNVSFIVYFNEIACILPILHPMTFSFEMRHFSILHFQEFFDCTLNIERLEYYHLIFIKAYDRHLVRSSVVKSKIKAVA
jgi:hypothetical protein